MENTKKTHDTSHTRLGEKFLMRAVHGYFVMVLLISFCSVKSMDIRTTPILNLDIWAQDLKYADVSTTPEVESGHLDLSLKLSPPGHIPTKNNELERTLTRPAPCEEEYLSKHAERVSETGNEEHRKEIRVDLSHSSGSEEGKTVGFKRKGNSEASNIFKKQEAFYEFLRGEDPEKGFRESSANSPNQYSPWRWHSADKTGSKETDPPAQPVKNIPEDHRQFSLNTDQLESTFPKATPSDADPLENNAEFSTLEKFQKRLHEKKMLVSSNQSDIGGRCPLGLRRKTSSERQLALKTQDMLETSFEVEHPQRGSDEADGPCQWEHRLCNSQANHLIYSKNTHETPKEMLNLELEVFKPSFIHTTKSHLHCDRLPDREIALGTETHTLVNENLNQVSCSITEECTSKTLGKVKGKARCQRAISYERMRYIANESIKQGNTEIEKLGISSEVEKFVERNKKHIVFSPKTRHQPNVFDPSLDVQLLENLYTFEGMHTETLKKVFAIFLYEIKLSNQVVPLCLKNEKTTIKKVQRTAWGFFQELWEVFLRWGTFPVEPESALRSNSCISQNGIGSILNRMKNAFLNIQGFSEGYKLMQFSRFLLALFLSEHQKPLYLSVKSPSKPEISLHFTKKLSDLIEKSIIPSDRCASLKVGRKPGLRRIGSS